MKKLGKISKGMRNTIEYFASTSSCWCYCSCYCTIECDVYCGGTASYNSHFSSEGADIYVSETNSDETGDMVL